jgi:hypothetical protein
MKERALRITVTLPEDLVADLRSHEAAQWHVPFADQFAISKDAMEQLVTAIALAQKEQHSFDDLEREMRNVDQLWDRSTLFDACRYAFLSRKYEPVFWHTLVGSDSHSGLRSRLGMSDDLVHLDLMNPPAYFGSS